MTKSILIVEDESMLQDVYKIILSSEGYEVLTANNGLEGLQKIKAHHPDMVLLDVFMPLMDGREFMRNIDMADYPDTKIIIYSNLSDRKVENEMLSLGACKFVVKSSMSPRDLLLLTKQTIGSSS